MSFKIILFSILNITISSVFSQETVIEQDTSIKISGTVIVTPNADYEANGLHEWFFGEHWRDLWATPAEFPVINLDGYEITDSSASTGKQTKSFEFTDGKKLYKFRSTQKYSRSIDPELYETHVGQIIEDQLSTKHPYAPILAYNLLKSVDVFMPEPLAVVIPNDFGIAEYRGMLGTVQEQPKNEFMGLKNISKTEKILKFMNEDAVNQVDAVEFLKVRLMDILMGDWDRHDGQWRWGSYENENMKMWRPVSLDRDEAFARYDGLFPWIYALAIPRYEGFSEDYPQVDDLTWEGRFIDRRFLIPVTKEQWDSVTAYVKTSVTDEVIRNAVNQMPKSWVDKKGDFIINALKERRDHLNEMSSNYYTLIYKQPDVWASDKDENAHIEYIADNKVRLSIFPKSSDMKKDKPVFTRVFENAPTYEVRLYMQGGDDDIIMTGISDDDITFRIVGGDGKDRIINQAAGNDFDVIFYDSDKNTVMESDNIYWDDEKWKMPKDVIKRINPEPQDFDIDWKIKPWFGYSSDDGAIIGAGPVFQKFGFRYKPFKYRLQLQGAYATSSKAYHIRFLSQFYNIFRKINTQVNLYTSTLDFTHFYGLGNNTPYDETLYENNFYRVEQNFNRIELALVKEFFPDFSGTIGLSFSYITTKNKPGTITDLLRPTGLGSYNFYGLNAGLLYEGDGPDLKLIKGTHVDLSTEYLPDLFDKGFDYTKVRLNFRKLFLQNFMKKSFFIVTGHAEKIFGTYPFYEAAHLGGVTLRGYNRERFSGDAAISGGLELNMYIARLRLILPSDFGISIFSDVGRVFLKGETSKAIYYGYGGGIWLSYFRNAITLQFTAANTKEGMKYYLVTGFGF